MMSNPYNQDRTDALQEVVNIAMGQAGSSLAKILDTFVQLSVPHISLVPSGNVISSMIDLVEEDGPVTAIRQAFHEDLAGEAIVIFSRYGFSDLAGLMGYEGELDTASEKELLLEICNILVGALLNGISETLGKQLSYSPPSILSYRGNLETILKSQKIASSKALLLEVQFALKKHDFNCHLVLVLTEQVLNSLSDMLDDFMDSL